LSQPWIFTSKTLANPHKKQEFVILTFRPFEKGARTLSCLGETKTQSVNLSDLETGLVELNQVITLLAAKITGRLRAYD